MNQDYSRRDFIKTAVEGGTVFLFGGFGVLKVAQAAVDEKTKEEDKDKNKEPKKTIFTMVVVDYAKCTGCRTCETVCSAYNYKRMVEDEILNGLGNPHDSNIKVYNYNPDVDIPVVCMMCPDAPCVQSCPVEPDPETNQRALYRDEKTLTIKLNPDRCVGCGTCSMVCTAGTIIPNPDSNQPEGICTLCDGDPQCVKYCPYGALSYLEVDAKSRFYGMRADKIAEELIKEWYGEVRSGE